MNATTPEIAVVLCDLDGVVWLAHEPIPGSVEAIARFRSSGRRVLFVTNNSAARIEDHTAALEAIGVPAQGDVISSATAAARLIEPGEVVLVTGGPGIVQAVEARGAVAIVNDGSLDGPAAAAMGFDAVVVGLDRSFDYERLTVAASAVQGGARLIGTNSDPTFPTPRGLEPGGGSIVAAVAVAGDSEPSFAGKPHPAMAAAIVDMLSSEARSGPLDPSTLLMVGDRLDTDGAMAENLRCRFALVRSGATRPDVDVGTDEVAVDFDVIDLAGLASLLLG